MKSKEPIFLKVLLNKYHPGQEGAFLKSLPKEEAEQVAKQPQTSNNPSDIFTWPEFLISRTHYSWLAPILQNMPPSLQPSILSALPENTIQGLQKLTELTPQSATLSTPAKSFLIQQLYRKWSPVEAVPVEFLTKTSLSPILNLNKRELVQLIDFLGLYDLVDSIRHIVDKKYLKAIYVALTPEKQEFVRSLLHKKEKVTSPKIEFSKWDSQADSLNDMLHKRGLVRFTKALCGQDPDFLWHITHILDTGRGKTISQNVAEKEIPGVTPLLIQQVLNIMNFIKQKSAE